MLKNVISIMDGAAGSCGKAKVIGEIATDEKINLGASISNCMPNAGHTFVDSEGNRTVFRNIPVSIVNPNCELFIGPGSAIDMDVFVKEYDDASKYLNNRKIYVHELVPLIEKRHQEYEKATIQSGSTYKGCGAVSKDKIMRDKDLNFFKTYKNAVVCKNDEWLDRLYNHLDNDQEYIMLEGSQGADLSLNHSGNYPYVTSRNISTSQLLADSGISSERLLQTIMVFRPFPIRISNVTPSENYAYSGNYGNGAELTWTQINLALSIGGYPFQNDLNEYNVSINPEVIWKLANECPTKYLKQLFGINHNGKNINEITLIESLELERLVNKAKGITTYKSLIINDTIIDQSEETTVTKMERRFFDLDINKLKNNCRINTPSSLYLNFFQGLNYDYKDVKGNFDEFYFNHYIREYINYIETNTQVEIAALGTGEKNGDCILKKTLVKEIKKEG